MNPIISIYGIFRGNDCLYIGRTKSPWRREIAHKTKFGKDTELCILKTTRSVKHASKLERELTLKFKAVRQAQFNGKLGLSRPNRQPVTLDKKWHRRFKILAAKRDMLIEDLVDEAAFLYLRTGATIPQRRGDEE